MLRVLQYIGIPLLLFGLFFSYQHSSVTPAPQTAALIETQPSVDPLDERVASMTLEQKVGQLLIAGHWQDSNYHHTKNLVRAYELGGVIIMKTPTETISEIPTWTSLWQAETEIPLMIAIDQEGGVVNRITAEGYEQIAQPDITDSEEAYLVAQKRGVELHELGINTNFAPVLEESSNPFAFLYDRTFRNPDTVGALGQAMIAGMREQQVVAVPKHFPGHEDTPADSHIELPIVAISQADFANHVRHFSRVIAIAEPEAIMTAHVQIPALDAEHPATLSKTLLTTQLREEIGFSGVIVTDDMTMGAITNTYDTAEAALLAIQAGADMILFAAEPNQVIDTKQHLLQAIETGELSEDRINQSVRRILEMKDVY